MMNITDKDLLNELKVRFDKNKELIKQQNHLMEQLKNVNQKLISSEGLKSNFLSNIRNEINNPISAILELSKSISNGNVANGDIENISKLIYDEVFNLDFQLRNIFISAELEAGEIKLSPSKISLRSLLDTILTGFNQTIKKRELKFVVEHTGDMEYFIGDPEKLHLVISNLISNAIRFSDDQGVVSVYLAVNQGNLVFRIMNSGKAISSEARKMIYDRFRQIEEGTNKTFGGHGLGLSIVKELTEFMNGEVFLNEANTEETEFVLKLKELAFEQDGLSFSDSGNDFIFGDVENVIF